MDKKGVEFTLTKVVEIILILAALIIGIVIISMVGKKILEFVGIL